jgi:hypothetical protein
LDIIDGSIDVFKLKFIKFKTSTCIAAGIAAEILFDLTPTLSKGEGANSQQHFMLKIG